MEDKYQYFYRPHAHPPNNEILDIDDILEGYLMPIKTTLQNQENIITSSTVSSSIDISHQKNPIPKSPRPISIRHKQILEVSRQAIIKKAKAMKGNCNETLNLNKFFHLEINNFVRQLSLCRYLTPEEIKATLLCSTKSKTFQTSRQIFKIQKIRILFLEYLKSSEVVSRIMGSSKMNFTRKIAIIKYLNKLCACTSEEGIDIKSWKK